MALQKKELPIEEIVALYLTGTHSLKSISKFYGVGYQTIGRRLKEAGIDTSSTRGPIREAQCIDCGIIVQTRAYNFLRCLICDKKRNCEVNKERYASGRFTPSQAKTKQTGHCDICGKFVKLHRDHDHNAECLCIGREMCDYCSRGLLCRYCNPGLGMFMDNPELLRKAADYIEKWKG